MKVPEMRVKGDEERDLEECVDGFLLNWNF